MKITVYVLIFAFIMFTSCKQEPMKYPDTQQADQEDEYFGTLVADPYRWLEDDNSEETKEWVAAQNEVSFAYLDRIPFRGKIRDRLTSVWDYPKMSAPWYDGGYYFFAKNEGLQNQSVYYILDTPGSEPRIILDPNTFSDDGTVALTAFKMSRNGKYLGYGISRGGSDWQEYMLREMATGTELEDHLKWIKFSGFAWFGDGFFYSRYPEPASGDKLKGENLHNKLYFHQAGTPQEKDRLVYEDPSNPGWSFYPSVSEDEKFLVLTVTESTSGNALYFKPLNREDGNFISLVESFEKDYIFIDHHNGKLLVLTNEDAPNYRLVGIPVKNPGKENWETIVPGKSDRVLQGVSLGGNKLFVSYLKDARSVVEVLDSDGNYLYDLELPGIGTLASFNSRMDQNLAFYTFTSYTYPPVIFMYDIEKNLAEVYYQSEVDFDPGAYETRQVFFESKDGTKVPMFIVHRKGIKLNGKNPAWLYGYGGFNVSQTPGFSTGRIIWLENGGILAVANLRGGGEYGEDWHKAGTKMNKQNVFDDFISAAEYLINEKYTSSEKLVIQGGSNGGLLVGAVINQSPELFRVALPAVGVMDMLRYHKFTIGRYWATDYGTSEESREMFEYLYAYSPLHNIGKGLNYPAVLVTTADHDDRVVPAHSFKYMATLQEKYSGKNPVLIRIETQAGHGGGRPTSKIIDELTDVYSFAFYNLGVKPEY